MGFQKSPDKPVPRTETGRPQDWAEKVYKPEIINKPNGLYQKPGYTM
jgi:hypothetical protein